MAPLFFLALVAAGAGSLFGVIPLWTVSIGMLAFAVAASEKADLGRSAAGFAVVGYALIVLVSSLATSAAYSPAGLYHPLFLLLAYVVLRGCSKSDEGVIAGAICGLAVGLAIWGLLQIGFFGMGRARAFFETPATYAVVLLLALTPALAAVLAGRREAALLIVAATLASGIFASQSRGALLALAAGLGTATVLALRANLLRGRGVVLAFLLLFAGWGGAELIRAAPSPAAPALTDEMRAESSISRLELYALAWNSRGEHPITGAGYLTFRYALERGRAQVPSYGESNQTWFVHNDYLQTLLELGPAGLLAFLGLTVLPPVLAYRGAPRVMEDGQRLAVVAAASGLSAMSIHALVDFPFYIPLCLLLYGALLGALDRRLTVGALSLPTRWHSASWYRAGRAALLTVAAVVLLRPAFAETVADWGLRKSQAADARGTALLLGLAQRIDPRDWRYHWYAGQFWELQAMRNSNPDAARRAADAYAAGFDANPLEVRNLLGRISVHHRLGALLDSPADRATLLAWQAQAQALAPFNREIRSALAPHGAAE